MLQTKELLFFSLVFVMVLISILASRNIDANYPRYALCINIAMCIVITILLFLIYLKGKVYENNSENFHFEVTPSKKCAGGPYMHQSGPENTNCKELLSTQDGIDDYNEYNCDNPGFYGRPVHFEYTTLSNDMWQNERCTGPFVGTPKVL